jgi:hypothetical protein
MAPVAGFNSKVRLGGQVLTVRRWSVRERARDNDVTNTEGSPAGTLGTVEISAESHLGGSTVAEITCEGTSWDPTENWFDAPRNVAAGAYVDLQIYPDGLGGPSWNFPSVLITSVDNSGDATALVPVSFTGISDGGYTRPVG